MLNTTMRAAALAALLGAGVLAGLPGSSGVTPAAAQSTPPTGAAAPPAAGVPADPNAAANPPIRRSGDGRADLPAPGANSFTETQVRTRLESRGYVAIEGLTRGEDGVWRARATRNGKTNQVAVDYQGNVIAE